jgi:hypothetical protein
MHNITYLTIETTDGRTKLIIEIDISPDTIENAPMSGTGRTRRVGSTQGFVPLPGEEPKLIMSVNVMAKITKQK